MLDAIQPSRVVDPFSSAGILQSDVHSWGESSTVDKEGIGCTLKKIIIRTKEDRFHRGVISNHGEYNIGLGGHCGKSLSVITAKLGGECRGGILIYIVYTADGVSLIFQVAGHVGSHASDADKSDSFLFRVHSEE
jgi:hypothetical protein